MKKEWALYSAWLLACIASLVSLYFSVVRNFEPCHLCWYQRIALFPLVPILGIATYRSFFGIVPFVLPQVVLGLFVALYQIGIQEIPGWDPIALCGAGPACSEKIPIGLGWVTIPMLSATGFSLILGLLLAVARREPRELAFVPVRER